MTIILAMQDSERSLLIGSDSMEACGTGLRDFGEKLYCMSNLPPLAWGCSGNCDLIEEFAKWMRAQPWPPASWDAFRGQIRGKVADPNRQQREMTERSGARWSGDYGIDCLIVGWLLGNPIVEAYSSEGLKVGYSEGELTSIGSATSIAEVAFRTMRGAQLSEEEKFEIILDIVTELATECHDPARIWRLLPTEIRDKQSGNMLVGEGAAATRSEEGNSVLAGHGVSLV